MIKSKADMTKKVYDPDKDGVLNVGFSLADDEKAYFGDNDDFSIRKDSTTGALIIRNENTGKDSYPFY